MKFIVFHNFTASSLAIQIKCAFEYWSESIISLFSATSLNYWICNKKWLNILNFRNYGMVRLYFVAQTCLRTIFNYFESEKLPFGLNFFSPYQVNCWYLVSWEKCSSPHFSNNSLFWNSYSILKQCVFFFTILIVAF